MVGSIKSPYKQTRVCWTAKILPRYRFQFLESSNVILPGLECTIVLCGPWLSGGWKKALLQCLKGKSRQGQLFGLDVKETWTLSGDVFSLGFQTPCCWRYSDPKNIPKRPHLTWGGIWKTRVSFILVSLIAENEKTWAMKVRYIWTYESNWIISRIFGVQNKKHIWVATTYKVGPYQF